MKINAINLAALFFGTALSASATMLTAENESLLVRYNDVESHFSIVEKVSGSVFLKSGTFDGNAVKVKTQGVRDAVFGSGKGIVITQADGSIVSLELYPDLPFVLVRGIRHNPGKATLDVSKVAPAMFTLDLGKSANELRTMGTAGLTEEM